jgi:putative sterol carrier protein
MEPHHRAARTPAAVRVRFVDGRPRVEAADDPATLVVSSDERTLCDVLRLQLSPNEPYLFGELTVQGPEADFVRLDYIAMELCPS